MFFTIGAMLEKYLCSLYLNDLVNIKNQIAVSIALDRFQGQIASYRTNPIFSPTTEIRNLTFNDEDAVQPLLELKQNYPNSDVFISGNLAVDFPEDIQVQKIRTRFQ